MTARKKILLVDDDDAVIEVLHLRLAPHYDVISTNSPANAFGLARDHRPDLIVCDIDMPEMDGGDISAALHADRDLNHIPFLYLTGLASPGDLQAKRQELAGRAAISKHSKSEELLARIRQMIG